MKIQIGEIYMSKITHEPAMYPNRTRKYLLPSLLFYGDEFAKMFNPVFKVAAGIGDIVLDNANLKFEKHLFVLCDSKMTPVHFNKFLTWIREQAHIYEDDYVYDNIQKSIFHMVVLKIPEANYQSLEAFKRGAYSLMYPMKTIEEFF